MTAADFLVRYPEFASIAATTEAAEVLIQQELDEQDAILSDSAFGRLRDMALRLVTAHRLAIRFKVTAATLRSAVTPGVLASSGASTGGLNQTIAHSALVTSDQAWRADYARTNYGLQYLALVDGSVAPGAVAGPAEDDTAPVNSVWTPPMP